MTLTDSCHKHLLHIHDVCDVSLMHTPSRKVLPEMPYRNFIYYCCKKMQSWHIYKTQNNNNAPFVKKIQRKIEQWLASEKKRQGSKTVCF